MNNSNLLSGVGYIRETMPHNMFAQLTAEASLARENNIPVNRELVGAIKEEYSIVHSEFLLGEFFEMINLKLLKWINFQKKYEYNPPHKHFGAYSFVIWLSLPYDTKKEKEFYRASTDFNFLYTQNGHIQQCPIDPSEGDIVVFPADQWHSVLPFFLSDEFRVSISGNIFKPHEHIWDNF